jgi:hypothetical protein
VRVHLKRTDLAPVGKVIQGRVDAHRARRKCDQVRFGLVAWGLRVSHHPATGGLSGDFIPCHATRSYTSACSVHQRVLLPRIGLVLP